MTIYAWIIIACWLIFLAFWLVSAFGVKRTAPGTRKWSLEIGLRLAIFAAVVVAVHVLNTSRVPRLVRGYAYTTNPVAGIAGTILVVFGVGLAVWARVYLGSNWGMPMTQKEEPALVMGGPYAYVRHPIYSGFSLMMLGSAIGLSLVWIVPLSLSGAYFLFSAKREERYLLSQFPAEYRAYMQRTKMFVPFVF